MKWGAGARLWVRAIQFPHERQQLTEAQRHENNERLLNRPGWDAYFGSRAAYQEFLDSTITYPDRFPAIMEMHLADGRLYVVTCRQEADKREVLALTLDGESATRLQVPFRMRSLLRFYPYAIGNRHLYQLIPTGTSETWGLYATRLW